MKTPNILFGIALFLVVGTGCTPVQEETKIIISNPTNIQRLDEPVTMQRSEFSNYIGDNLSATIPVLETIDGEPVPSQVDDLNKDGEWDEFFFLVDLEPNVNLELVVTFAEPGAVPDYAERANVRFGSANPPYEELDEVVRLKSTETELSSAEFQMEGPAWENDVVAFRNYFDARNGIDIYGKRTSEMVMDSVGLFESYHELQDWGMDVLKVGNSLGAGAIALKVNDEIHRIGLPEEGTYRRLTDGPLRASFELTFKGMKVENNSYDILHHISIWGGTHFYKSTVNVSGLTGDESLVTGIVNMEIDTFSVINHNDQYVSLVTHGNQAFDGEILGMGILMHKEPFNQVTTAPESGEGIIQTYMASLNITEDKPVTFYFFAGWELQDPSFKDEDAFISVIDKYAQRLANPVDVNLE
jgi:hypothetical protein